MSNVHLIRASATQIPLQDESVQCVVTSPPYWGLRKYAGEQELIWPPQSRGLADPFICEEQGHEIREIRSSPPGTDKQASVRGANAVVAEHGTCIRCGAWRGAYGLEPSVEMYVDHSIQILRELRRVLRKDGVVFWNLGDSYAGNGQGWCINPNDKQLTQRYWAENNDTRDRPSNYISAKQQNGLKPKDLVLMPSRIALAAQADGWWVRSMIIWAKPNPMPESVTDRPTDSYEHIIQLTKSERYFWDADAVREESEDKAERVYAPNHKATWKYGPESSRLQDEGGKQYGAPGGTRNMRNLWMFATQPYSGAHFATFPEELPRRCILAATSEKGACAQCGTPWRRVSRLKISPHPNRWSKEPNAGQFNPEVNQYEFHGQALGMATSSVTIGWQPGCRCRGQHNKTVPCVVLDPFGGSGTTGRVALELNRTAYLLDVAYDAAGYLPLAQKRITGVQRNLPGL